MLNDLLGDIIGRVVLVVEESVFAFHPIELPAVAGPNKPGRADIAPIRPGLEMGNPVIVHEVGILVGMAEENGIDVPEEAGSRILGFLDRGCTAIYVGISGRIAGFLALSDTLRYDAPGTISEIKDCGTVPVLMTGDGEKAAAYMAGRLGIERVYAGCLPEDKLNRIDEYQETGNQVCMVGDGINDAPALKKAFVGIAMGGVGSDIAVEAADIALINDRICELPHLIRLAKRMMITIKCNLTFSMTLNFVAIILAMTGVLNPVIGALVHNAGSVLVIINSALLLRWKKRK